MSTIEILLGLAPVMILIAFVVFAVLMQAFSKPHGLNRRGGSPHSFGGAWTDYTPDDSLHHPDFDDPEPEILTRKNRKRKKKPSRRK